MSWPTGFTDKELDDLEQDLRDAYAQAWVSVRDEMKKSYQKYYDEYKKQEKLYKKKQISKEQLTEWKRAHLGIAERWDKMTDNIASKLYGVNKLATEYVNDTTPTVYAMNANYQAYLIEQAVPTVQLDNGVTLGVSFDLVDEAAVKAAIFDPASPMYGKLHTEFRVYSINPIRDYQWNTQKIKSALTAGILAGDSVADMTNRFMGIMQNNRTAAIRNARTSITSAHNAGREHTFETAQEMGIKIKKQWVATLDSRTRDSHQDMDGEMREIGERYSNGLMYPGDPDGAPEEVYNCRCSEIGVIDGTQVTSGRRIARDENGKNVYLNNFTFKGSATSNNYAEWLEQKNKL